MLQAHSFLWSYLWVAPNVFLLILGFLIWRRGLGRKMPAFLAFAVLSATGDIAAFLADVTPSVTAENYWRILWAGLLVESLLKFLVIGEVFSRLLDQYPAIARLGKLMVSGLGAMLVLLAALIAAFAQGDSTKSLISGAHLLEQTVFIIESGLILFLFSFVAYFHLWWDRVSFGVLLGLGISSFEHLATWAIIANASPSANVRTLFAFLNMATYHFCVFVWLYYLLVPQKVTAKSSFPPPDNNLATWNRELERFLHQ